MKFVLLVLLLAATALAFDNTPVATVGMVRMINAKTNLWHASMASPTAGLTRDEARSLLGLNEKAAWTDPKNPPLQKFTAKQLLNAPDTFDPREQWPSCTTMTMIRDQSKCGSCWAFGAVEAISDRECVTNKLNVPISAEDMNSCSGAGDCDGGYPSSAMYYWQESGVVSEACRPYSLPGCDHHIANSSNPCPSEEYPTPDCVEKCVNGADWKTDKHVASKVYTVGGEANMKTELSTNGPCEGAFTVYDDFLSYQSGIYHHVTGSYDGGHAIKVLGYGIDNGVKYWLCANSWNEHWGERGYFRIKRGNNECGIENTIWCGTPATR